MSKDPILSNAFGSIIGQPAWQVRLGHGSFLTFEFGNPTLERRDPFEGHPDRRITVRGHWHLWIYCCSWRITNRGKELSTSEDSREKMASAAHYLDGQILSRVEKNADKEKCVFEFDLGGRLETWLNPADPADQWMLYHGGDVWTLRADQEISRTSVDEM